MLTSLRPLRSTLPAALLALSLAAVAPRESSAQAGTVIQVPYALDARHVAAKPYNFTGRVLSIGDTEIEFGSATLVRRHTALTAAHVVFSATTGFIKNPTFSRALYGTFSLDKVQVSAVNVLSGYTADAASFGENSITTFARDLGYLLFTAAPIDEDWGTYTTDTTLLTNATSQFFVLGYPGVTFDGRTMAYVVPMTPFVQLGTGDTGSFENEEYQVESGMSGGPVYVVPAGTKTQLIAGETVGGLDDPTGEFNFSIIRGINAEANVLLTGAEYTSGLIKKVKIKGPTTVAKGSTVTFTTKIVFATKNAAGVQQTTDRYPEVKLMSDNAGTATTSKVVTIKKVSNTEFQVTFASTIRSGTTATFSAYYGTNLPVVNKNGQNTGTLTVKIQ